ncbi:Protein CrcB homolog [[Clostridium] ultunense Esp]|nr:Protein CrcB homolog [[Clostridium] ultunense Esp]
MEKLQFLIAVATGGALGAIARYLVTLFIGDRIGGVFPWGTWVVNLVGSLLIGFIFTLSVETTALSTNLRLFLITGFLGGFTTFSSFANESLLLFRQGFNTMALLYMVSTNFLGILFVILAPPWPIGSSDS